MRLLPVLALLAPFLPLATVPVHAQNNPSFLLANRGDQPIEELYATPATIDRWGRDRLALFFLPPGMTYPVRLPADGTCLYDLRVVYADGRPEEKRRLDVCHVDSVAFPGARTVGNGSPTPRGPNTSGPNTPPPNGNGRAETPSDDPSFRLVNRGRSEINEVYVSATGDDDWGEDRLGDDTVAKGASRVIQMPRGQCRYDVRVVFDDGNSTEKRNLDLCKLTDLRVP